MSIEIGIQKVIHFDDQSARSVGRDRDLYLQVEARPAKDEEGFILAITYRTRLKITETDEIVASIVTESWFAYNPAERVLLEDIVSMYESAYQYALNQYQERSQGTDFEGIPFPKLDTNMQQIQNIYNTMSAE